MDKIRFRCRSCSRKLNVAPLGAGKRVRCPDCGTVQQAPLTPTEEFCRDAASAGPTSAERGLSTKAPLASAAAPDPAVVRAPEIVSPLEPLGEHDFASREIDEGDEYRYDAFISYRHVDPDRRWAQWLHGALERYRTPPALVRERGLLPRIKRVFRDEEELPASADLSQEIARALQASRYLIVICSPATPASEWVNKEVEQFREMGRHDRILALLIGGEPAESFPRALREIRRTLVDNNGLSCQRIEAVEPLAADVRRSRADPPRHLKRMAKLRLLACVLGCRFDDLRQRERERRMKRVVLGSVAMAAVLLVVAGLAVLAVLQAGKAQRMSDLAAEKQATAVREQERAHLAVGKETFQRRLALENDYLNHISLAQRELDADNIMRVNELLEECPPELRQWEWRYLKRMANADKLAIASWRASISPDGRWVSFRDMSGPKGFVVLDVQTGRATRFCAEEDVGNLFAVSPDGTRVALIRPRPRKVAQIVEIWDVQADKSLHIVKEHQDCMEALRFSHNGRFLASVSQDKAVLVTDVQTGQVIHHLEGGRHNLAFSRDDRFLWSCDRVWDLQDQRIALVLSDGGYHAAFADNHRLAVVRFGGPLECWDLAGGKRLLVVPGKHDGVAISPDGFQCATVQDGRLCLWNATNGTLLRRLHSRIDWVGSMAYTPDGNTLICSDTNACRYFSPRGSGGGSESYPVQTEPGTFILGGTWNGQTGTPSSDGTWIVSTSTWSQFQVLNVRTGKTSPINAPGKIVTWAFNRDGRLLATATGAQPSSGSPETDVHVWNVASGELLHQFKGPSTGIMQLAFHPNGLQLAGACAGDMSSSIVGHVRLWDLTGKNPMRQLKGGACVAYSPDGKWIATAADDYHYGIVSLWDAASGDRVNALGGHGSIVTSLAFDASNSRLASGCMDSAVRLYSIPDGKLLTTCTGTAGTVYGVAISPDGKRLASAHFGNLLTIWDPVSGREVLCLRGHSGPVYAVSFTQDGTRIFSCGTREVRAWDATFAPRPAFETTYRVRRPTPGVNIKSR